MADNDCYGGQHFLLVAVDQISQRLRDQLQLSFGKYWDVLVTTCRCFGMLRCSGGQASHQVYQDQMYFDQSHKSSACGGDQVDPHVDGQVGVGNPMQLSCGDVFAQLDVLEVVEVVVVAFAVVLVVAVVLLMVVQFWVEGLSLHYQGSNLLTATS